MYDYIVNSVYTLFLEKPFADTENSGGSFLRTLAEGE